MNFIKRIKRRYLKDYLIFSVRRIEKFATASKRWDITPEMLELLTQLLLVYSPVLFTDETVSRLRQLKVRTQFENIKSFETYVDEFIGQTGLFIKGEGNGKPRIESFISEEIYDRDVLVTSFLGAETEIQLVRALKLLVALSKRLDDHLKDAPNARRTILLNMLKEVILPAYTVIEQIYEVVNSEDEAD